MYYCVGKHFVNDLSAEGMRSGENIFVTVYCQLLSESLYSVKEVLVIVYCEFSSLNHKSSFTKKIDSILP